MFAFFKRCSASFDAEILILILKLSAVRWRKKCDTIHGWMDEYTLLIPNREIQVLQQQVCQAHNTPHKIEKKYNKYKCKNIRTAKLFKNKEFKESLCQTEEKCCAL